jgi:methylase of polypeptide subunit release factors
VARKVVSTLYDVLGKTDVPFVKVMFQQWSMQFKEVCDYEKASKLDLALEAEKFGIKEEDVDPFRFFFCLHTYYATFIKLLAVQIVQFYLMPKFGTNLRQAASADDAKLKAFMDKLERGGVFKDFGINNFLEGDFFKWYVEAWDDRIAAAMRETIRVLANYSLITLDVDPNVTRDILKILYQGLVPKRLRHNLGEYYTPDWLAERLIDMTVVGDLKPTDKILDPACGSGTFLVLCIRKMREYARKKMLPESEVLDKILLNVVGFDLNPLAVISSRTNFLLALGDLLEHRKGDISIPVYLCDSVVTPHEGEDMFGKDRFKIKTAVGDFVLPKTVIRRDLIKRMAEVLEELVDVEVDRPACIERLASELMLDRNKNAVDLGLLADLYEQLLDKKRQHINGVWARVIKNAFAPMFLKNFDYVVGNPPWVNWESLPETYRDQEVIPLFQDKYGLFPHKGLRARHGSSKIDISALMTYVVADENLVDKGRLGFLITQSVFKTDAGKGFRKLTLPNGMPLGMVHVDDITAFQPFEGATNRTAAFVLERGSATEYGKKAWYMMWLRKPGKPGSLPQDAAWSVVEDRVDFNQFIAEPVDLGDPTTQWLTGRPMALKAVRRAQGASDYTAHAGAYTGGANGVYWVEIKDTTPAGLAYVVNITEGAKREVESLQAPVERDLLYPLLRGRDVARWQAPPSAHIIVPQQPEDPKFAIPEARMKSAFPNTYKWFLRFRHDLAKRKSQVVMDLAEKQGFYFMYSVKQYTFAPWKVVWRYIADEMTAAVVGPSGGRTVVPDHRLMIVPFDRANEAHFLSAALNSAVSRYMVATLAIGTQISTYVLENIRVPKFDTGDETHTGLAKLSAQAHEATAKGDAERVAKIEEQVDLLAAKLWGLSYKELKEIKLALEELR